MNSYHYDFHPIPHCALKTLLLYGFLFSNLLACTPEQDPTVLAGIGPYKVTEKHFTNAFLEYYQRTGQSIPVNEITKQTVLEAELDRYVIVTWAEERQWDRDVEGSRQKALIERQVLMEAYKKQIVWPRVGVDEYDLRELYRRFNTRLRASHLYAPDKATADSLYRLLEQGSSFEALAATIFSNPHLKQSGGDLGFFGVDEMDPAFENIAYRMQPGEISPPVRTEQGYSIIKLTEIRPNPLLTENEFAKRRASMQQYALARNREMAVRSDLEQRIAEITWNAKALDQVLNQILNPKISWQEGKRVVNLPDQTVIARLGTAVVTAKTLNTELNLTPNQRYGTPKALKEVIEGIVYRHYAMQQVRENPQFDAAFTEATVQATFHEWLIQRFNQYLDQEILIADQLLRKEYEQDPEFQKSDLQLNLAELVTSSEAEALQAIRELKAGVPFKQVLTQRGVVGEALLYDGEIGWRAIDEFGMFAPALRAIQPGEVSAPLEYAADRWIVYLCKDRRAPTTVSFEEAKPRIRALKKEEEIKKLRSSIIDETRKKHKASLDLEKLKSISITL